MEGRDDPGAPGLRRLEELFHGALERPPEAREAFLAEACGGDAALLARVQALVAAAEADLTLGARGPGDDPAEGAGAEIGRYRLLQKIGEGGFGTVFMAEQTEPVRRKVALKIVRPGMDSREVVARFEAERQALAIMDHPNIARVLDGGTTPSGRPYFVMELVRGESITAYCDRERLPTRERLQLFCRVCLAVQHAHQKGVIHRDLKPSNVMVTMHDGQPVPKVIDFGVAKAMHAPLTDKTLFTAYGRFIGTPAYMSPEQAELSALDVDTRSDIYSLGVLLYEILTGTTPFDARKLLERGLLAIQQTIREEQPVRPSVRVGTSSDAIAGLRRSDPQSLARRLRGDLDWIVMKCLEKDRLRRYATASDVAADLERHLQSEPVLAGPPGALYRARKFLARNRLAVASAATVALALVVGIVGTSLGMLEAARQRDEALHARVHAEEETARTAAVTDFLVRTLALTDPAVALDTDVSLATFLRKVSGEVEQAFAEQPAGEARVRLTIGRAFKALGENALAERHLRAGIALAGAQSGFDPVELYHGLWALTHVLFTLERPDAMATAQDARRVAHAYVGRTHPALAAALDRFNAVAIDAAMALDPAAIERVPDGFVETVRVSDAELAAGDPLWPIVADSWIAAGYIVWYSPLDALAERFLRRAVEVLRREARPDDPQLGEAVGMLVDALNRHGRAEEAEREMRETVRRLRLVLPDGTPQLAQAESMLGESLAGLGRHEEAEELLLRSHAVLVAAIGDRTSFLAAESFRRVLAMYVGWGRAEPAARFRAELVRLCADAESLMPWAVARLCFGPGQEALRDAADALDARAGPGSYAARAGELPAAEVEALARELVALRRAQVADDDPLAVLLAREMAAWARLLAADGSLELRASLAQEALALLEPHEATLPLDVADAHALVSAVLWERGDASAAHAHARRAAAAYAGQERHWALATATVRVGRTLVEEGLLAEAEPLLLAAHRSLELQFGAESSDALAAGELLAELYARWGRTEDARAYARRAAPAAR